MINSFYRAYISEQYKLSKNRQLFWVLLFPVLIIFMADSYILYEATRSEIVGSVPNPWKLLLGRYVFQFFYLIYPILIAIFVYACCDVEYKNNNYKILFTSPVSKAKIFFAKAVFIIVVVLFSVLLAYFFFLLSGFTLSRLVPELGFQNYDYREVIFFTFLRLFITLSAIAMIQLALSLVVRSFIFPMGFSMFMIVFSGIAANKEFSDFIPYTGSIKSLTNIMSENISFERLDYSNLVMAGIFLMLSFYLFKRKGAL